MFNDIYISHFLYYMVSTFVVKQLYMHENDFLCSNSRCIRLLSVVGKLFGRVLINRTWTGTECAIGRSNVGLRQGRGCMHAPMK